jgi:hypothetical protein
MQNKRNYKAEYAKRKTQGLARGFSLNQIRGHAKSGEPKVSEISKQSRYNKRLEEGVKEVRKGKSLAKAAGSIRVDPRTLRNYLNRAGVAEKQGRRFRVGLDPRPRTIPIYSAGREHHITVPSYEPSAKIGSYHDAVKKFINSNDPSYLKPFIGKSVRDINGTRYIFETNPNTLYRLTLTATSTIEEIYRIHM